MIRHLGYTRERLAQMAGRLHGRIYPESRAADQVLVSEAVDVLMEAVPGHIDVEALRRSLEGVPGTDEVHDLHVWSLTSGRYALSAHAVIAPEQADCDAILAAMAEVCARDFQIQHVTIQIEHESRRAAEPTH